MDKSKETCLLKYGVDNPSKSYVIKEKNKQNFIKKYGVDNPWKAELIKRKIKETRLIKYGNENFNNREKAKETCLKKYGKNNPSQVSFIREKAKETCLKKYGAEYSFKSEKIKNKILDTNIKKYGKKSAKILESWKLLNTFNSVIPLFTFNEFKGGNKIEYKWKCVKCNTIFYSRYDNGYVTKKCPKCLKEILSQKEIDLVNFCKQYFPNLKENDRKLIKPLELDIIISEIKLAIEFNGKYWHNLDHKPLGYHLNKTIECEKLGYRLIHIWEDEWDNNKDEIKRKLIEIFEGKEIIDYSKPLDRSWYQIKNIDGYEYQIIDPIVENNLEKCGFIVYKRKK